VCGLCVVCVVCGVCVCVCGVCMCVFTHVCVSVSMCVYAMQDCIWLPHRKASITVCPQSL